jgi:hypothetical protein
MKLSVSVPDHLWATASAQLANAGPSSVVQAALAALTGQTAPTSPTRHGRCDSRSCPCYRQGLADARLVPTPDAPRDVPWTTAELQRFSDNLPYKGVRVLLDMCAAHPAKWIPKSMIDATTGQHPRQLATELGAMTKLIRREHGHTNAPFAVRKTSGKFLYRMPPVVAEAWKNLKETS